LHGLFLLFGEADFVRIDVANTVALC
jgi:hypothetical protein